MGLNWNKKNYHLSGYMKLMSTLNCILYSYSTCNTCIAIDVLGCYPVCDVCLYRVVPWLPALNYHITMLWTTLDDEVAFDNKRLLDAHPVVWNSLPSITAGSFRMKDEGTSNIVHASIKSYRAELILRNMNASQRRHSSSWWFHTQD